MGFWAFEMERRGDGQVVAIDVAKFGNFDWLPQGKARMGAAVDHRSHFVVAHALKRSQVHFRVGNVYDLSPETVGVFDVVFCGSLLLHLQNPIKALVNIRSVTRQMAIIETSVDPNLEGRFPDRPYVSFGHRECEKELGESCTANPAFTGSSRHGRWKKRYNPRDSLRHGHSHLLSCRHTDSR